MSGLPAEGFKIRATGPKRLRRANIRQVKTSYPKVSSRMCEKRENLSDLAIDRPPLIEKGH